MIRVDVVPRKGPTVSVGACTDPDRVEFKIGNAQVEIDRDSAVDFLSAIASVVEFQGARRTRAAANDINRRAELR